MDVDAHIRLLDSEGEELLRAAEAAGFDAEIPTTPEWKVRDLLAHVGTAHRWFAGLVADACSTFRPPDDAPEIDVTALSAWYRDGQRKLVETLRTAPSDLECWTLLPASSPLAFWTRRSAHETAIHRADAQSATMRPAPVGSEFGADGIEELLFGFHSRESSNVRSAEPKVLRVRATDSDEVWTIHITLDPPRTIVGAEGAAHCEMSGPAGRLYLALWNRAAVPEISGDVSVADLWRERSAVRFE